MSELIKIPAPLSQQIERLKNSPDEPPMDVIARIVNYYDYDEEIDLELT